ncbi:Putative peptidoglycan binding domain-containing protein [Micromonospora sediminicola]|uniref:Putative peptidoglycan binding domain-containing protein n=1 Tax=Micromonospora sediminicola TaxID=946078 RepID=A0A1A9B5Y4_9ACTN|nr:peptidoglycan-binding domain-containing protein [Micromonospora sediminicola]SBT64481.1 Putative peptidoglycan binding domain-containing protein [Micromonospora sediminicola]
MRYGIAIAMSAALIVGAATPASAAPIGTAALSTCNNWRSYNGADVPSYGTNISCVMRRGNTGKGVFQLQVTMNVCYDYVLAIQGVYPLTADSQFGPSTEKALRAVQRAVSETDDGIYGPATRNAMLHQGSNGAGCKFI